jgi:hypothetical protein
VNINSLLSGKWIKANDLGGDTPVTITKFAQDGTYSDGTPAYGITLAEFPGRMLGLNRTNIKTIAKLYGDDTDGWIGKRITLYATEVDNRGEMVMGIRIRLRPPTDQTGAAPAGMAPITAPSITFGPKGAAWLEGEMSKQPTDQASMLSALRQHLTVTQPALASVAAGPVDGWPKVWKPVVEAWLAESSDLPF